MRGRRAKPEHTGPAIRRRGPGGCAGRAEPPAGLREIDRALLRWFAVRLATVGPEANETELTDFLIAEGLGELERGRR